MYQVSEYESAEPAEDHTLFLRRASCVSTLKGGIGTTTSPGNAHPNPHRYPIQNAFGWALRAHPCPSKSPSIPIQNAFGWAVGGPRRSRSAAQLCVTHWSVVCQLPDSRSYEGPGLSGLKSSARSTGSKMLLS